MITYSHEIGTTGALTFTSWRRKLAIRIQFGDNELGSNEPQGMRSFY